LIYKDGLGFRCVRSIRSSTSPEQQQQQQSDINNSERHGHLFLLRPEQRLKLFYQCDIDDVILFAAHFLRRKRFCSASAKRCSAAQITRSAMQNREIRGAARYFIP